MKLGWLPRGSSGADPSAPLEQAGEGSATPLRAKPALLAIPDCAKAAQSGSPGVGGPGLSAEGLHKSQVGATC